MKQINKNKLCHTCLGCNRLELDNFYGVYHCQYYIRGVKDDNKNTNAVQKQKK